MIDGIIINVNLRTLRINNGYTRKELANRVGVTAETIRLIENGVFCPSLHTIVMLCLVLNCSFSELITIEDERGFQYFV